MSCLLYTGVDLRATSLFLVTSKLMILAWRKEPRGKQPLETALQNTQDTCLTATRNVNESTGSVVIVFLIPFIVRNKKQIWSGWGESNSTLYSLEG